MLGRCRHGCLFYVLFIHRSSVRKICFYMLKGQLYLRLMHCLICTIRYLHSNQH